MDEEDWKGLEVHGWRTLEVVEGDWKGLEVHGWRTLGVGEGDWKGFSGKEGFGPAVCFGVGGRGWGGVERQIEPLQRRKVKALLVITDANKTP